MKQDNLTLPRGVSDKLHGAAKQIKAIELLVLQVTERWGYQLVMPAPLEFEDTLVLGMGSELLGKAFRLDDWESGRMMAMPPDMTPQIARISATRLAGKPYPHRLCYSGTVLRHSERESGRQREVVQAGAELIGGVSARADAEVIAMVFELADQFGIRDFTINMSHVGICRGFLDGLPVDAQQKQAVRDAITRKDVTTVAALLKKCLVSEEIVMQARALTRLFGDFSVLEQATQIGWNESSQQALEELKAVMEAVTLHGGDRKKNITFDLGETRGLDYHTGVTFEGFSTHAGDALFSGGRYDTLMQKYGVSQPATGFTCNVTAVAAAIGLQQGLPDSGHDILFLHYGEEVLPIVEDLRRKGLSVLVSTEEISLTEGMVYASAHAIRYLVVKQKLIYSLVVLDTGRDHRLGEALDSQQILSLINVT